MLLKGQRRQKPLRLRGLRQQLLEFEEEYYAKNKSLPAKVFLSVGSEDFENKTKVFLNELEASMLTHEESVKLMVRKRSSSL